MRPRLPNVYWIGGPPDSGKSTVAGLLGEWFDVEVYRQDPREMEHITRADPFLHPRHVAMRRQIEQHDGQKSFFQGWVDRAPKELLDDARSNWEERISLICEDLAAFDPNRTVVAEGPGFFPNVITPLMASRRHAIWLIPTVAFNRASHERRDKSSWRFDTTDPERALANHIRRGLVLADAYRVSLSPLICRRPRSVAPRARRRSHGVWQRILA